MNVVVGIVVNSISEVQEQLTLEKHPELAEKKDGEDQGTVSETAGMDTASLEKKLSDMQLQIAHIEKILENNMNGEKNNG